MFLEVLPGYIKNKKPSKYLTLEELNERFENFILNIYYYRPHGTTKEPPIKRWNQPNFLPNLPTLGMILIGMPGIEKRLSRYPQLYSRIGFSHQLDKLTNDELKHILEYKWEELSLPVSYEDFEDYESINTVIKITNGNFRLVQRLFSQIIRIMEINELNKITVDVIETACEGLLIGENE